MAPHLADQPPDDARLEGARLDRSRPARRDGDRRGRLRPHADRPREHRAPGNRHPRHDRRRRHPELLDGPRRRRRPARRDPEDDGQRRPGHGVLHRLLDRDHSRARSDQPAADDAGVARADRGIPDLRPRRRVLRAVRRLRHIGAVRDPRAPVRPRATRRDPRRGPPQQSQPLRARPDRGGRDLGRGSHAGCRRRRHVRAPPQGQRRRGAGGRAEGADGDRDGRLGADLRPPVRASPIRSTRWSR